MTAVGKIEKKTRILKTTTQKNVQNNRMLAATTLQHTINTMSTFYNKKGDKKVVHQASFSDRLSTPMVDGNDLSTACWLGANGQKKNAGFC